MMPLRTLCLCALVVAASAFGQDPGDLNPTPRFRFTRDDVLTIHQPALPSHPLTVTGRSGAILGMQDGSVELWQLPVKFFSALHLRAEVEGYPVPIELNALAADLEVAPDHTTLTYSHAAITVRQHMFVPAGDPDDPKDPNAGLGGQVLFEIQSIHPATLYVSLTPALVQMWPAPQWGQPGWSWHAMGSGGAYEFGTDNPHVFGMIGMPNATPGPVSPYQEHPRTLPVEFRVHFDPARDTDRLFPLLCEMGRPGETNTAAGVAALRARLVTTSQNLPQIYARSQAYYAHYFDHRTTVHTPDPQFDKALAWAELAIEKSQATIPATAAGPAETGLVAGWYPSFDSARPGFGWFFGRDTLWSMYAIDSYGDASLARRSLSFLIRRQRADGKMPHEFSETAGQLSGDMAWDKLPYEYAAADATPLFLLAMQDYVRATGDTAFLEQHWEAVEKAYRFERTHDSDGDGVYDNSQGTGWVEDWPTQPHQELYLAALDRDATGAMKQLAAWTSHPQLAAEASQTAVQLQQQVAAYRQPNQMYAFSRNSDGSYDATATIYPAVAFWSRVDGLPASEPQLSTWSSHVFSTDWGTRALSTADPAYDPISYHRGTVWPLFTGWTATALYRTGHPIAGYAALRQNIDLTWAQDPGAVTELLSGRFYQPLGRSSTHQLWSSAMALAPALRQLFGVELDAPDHTMYVHPHLPPTWRQATLDHVRLGQTEYNLRFRREGGSLVVTAVSEKPTALCLRANAAYPERVEECHAAVATMHEATVPLPSLELSLSDSSLPSPGDETSRAHIKSEQTTARGLSITVEGLPNTTVDFHVTRNGDGATAAHTQDGQIEGDTLHVTIPAGSGWTEKQVRIQW